MTDNSRRGVLKMLSVSTAGVMVGVSSSLQALEWLPGKNNGAAMVDVSGGTSPPSITDVTFKIEADATLGVPVVEIENRAGLAATMRHVYPGVVHAEGRAYDLNVLLRDAPLTIGAGEVIRLPIPAARMGKNVSEQKIPKGLTKSTPVTIATRLRSSDNRWVPAGHVKTVRTAFA